MKPQNTSETGARPTNFTFVSATRTSFERTFPLVGAGEFVERERLARLKANARPPMGMDEARERARRFMIDRSVVMKTLAER